MFGVVKSMNTLRKATVAGMFYELSADKLQDQITWCFTHKIGPGFLPKEKKTDQKLLGIIVPHAGLVCSGPFAAHAYSALVEHGIPEVCILLGPNHSGMGPKIALDPSGSWETPLGPLLIDEPVSRALISSGVTADPRTLQQQENSLEVQLPFIKFLCDNLEKTCTIVPIVLTQQDKTSSVNLGNILFHILSEEKRDIVIIASSDFSHEGYSYGRFPPPGLTADDVARQQDKYALDAIQDKNPNALFDHVQNHQISMCGFGPVMSLLTVAKHFPDSSVELLKYGTSSDTCSDRNSCVGYGSFKITKKRRD